MSSPERSRRPSRGGRSPSPSPAAATSMTATMTSRMMRRLQSLTGRQRAVVGMVVLVGVVGVVVTAAYASHHFFFDWLAPRARVWRGKGGALAVVFLAVFLSAFPPLVGYSTAATVAGFVAGFPAGWPLAASAAVAGSLAAFFASRSVLAACVERLVGKDTRFVALAQVLRRDGLLCLTAIRFCPLPFSLSNGFLATVPSVSPWAFALATAISSPKLLVHVFIGSRLALLADEGDTMSSTDKAINYLSMLLSALIGLVVGLVVYRRTMARAAQLAREGLHHHHQHHHHHHHHHLSSSAAAAEVGYHDADAPLLDPDDAAAVMLDDDLPLWPVDDADARHDDDDHHAKATEQVGRTGHPPHEFSV